MIIKNNCLFCSKVFSRQLSPSNIKVGKGKYCSVICSAKGWKKLYKNGKIKPFFDGLKKGRIKGKTVSIKTRKKISISLKGKCGELARNWQGGLTKLHFGDRFTNEYEEWRRSVNERDNHTCQICGVREKNIQANHIKRFSEYPELRFEVNNGIALCRDCHYSIRGEEKEWEKRFYKNLETRGFLRD